MINPIVEVDDDLINAKGTWYLWQPCTLGTPEGPKPVWLTGLYADRYRKEGGSWRFSDVRLDIETISPIAEGWVRRPFWDEG
jgi:SnoaL-like domain